MKILLIILALVALAAVAQITTVEVPVKLTVAVPIQPPHRQVIMTNNVIAPVSPGVELVKIVTGPTVFTLGTFPANSELSLIIVNPSTNAMIWPPSIVQMGTPLPVNQVRSAIIFIAIGSEVWAFPTYQFVPGVSLETPHGQSDNAVSLEAVKAYLKTHRIEP